MLKSNAAREKSSARFSGVGHGVALLLLVSGLLPQLLAAEKSARAPKDAGPKPASEANSIEALIRSTRPSVVVITQFGRDGRKEGEGTGFIVDAGGLIATSLHVIGEARPVSVQLADGRRFDVTEVFASDRKFDLALIRIAAKNLPALQLGDSDTLKQGAPVVAIGNPLGLRHSVVQGVVSARRDFDGIDMIQLAIPIEQGNSGGPLLDLKGRVHGVLTLKSALTPNLGFAMPVNLLKTLLEKPNPVPMTRWLHLGALSAKEWTPVFGARWRQRAGRIEVENPGDGFGGRALCLSQHALPGETYEVSVSVRLDDESGAAGLVFAADGGDRHYGFYPSGGQLRLTRFDGPNVFSWNILKQMPTPAYQPGEWNHLRVRVEPERILCYVNGQLVAETDDSELRGGKVGLAKFRDTRAQFRGFETGTNLATTARLAALPESLDTQIRELAGPADAALLSALGSNAAAAQLTLNLRASLLERQAVQLRRTARNVHRQAVQTELLQALSGPEERIDLFHAALLVAKFDQPELDPEPYRRQLDEMGRELKEKLPPRANDQARLDALVKFLFAENGFHGARSDYYNRANSYLNEVLDDREGLPITLSILFIELAHRIDLKGVVGMPLPGHFMVSHRPKRGEEQFIDVFDGGKRLSRSDAQERVFEATGRGFREEDLQPAGKRDIIVRVLRNLLGLTEGASGAAESARYLDLIVALQPDSAADRFARARARLQSGDTAGGKTDLQWLIDHQPPGMDVERLEELLRSL